MRDPLDIALAAIQREKVGVYPSLGGFWRRRGSTAKWQVVKLDKAFEQVVLGRKSQRRAMEWSTLVSNFLPWVSSREAAPAQGDVLLSIKGAKGGDHG